MSKKVKYVVHPVSPELKAKLREEGFKIVDARFAPKDADVLNPYAKPQKQPEKQPSGKGKK